MKYANISNIPNNPKEILDYALSKSYENWIDEKGTNDNPGHWQRRPSKLTYEEAFEIIQKNKPHWVFSFRNRSYISSSLKDYWEFGGCNIRNGDYGTVFIWIKVNIKDAYELFDKFNLNIHNIN